MRPQIECPSGRVALIMWTRAGSFYCCLVDSRGAKKILDVWKVPCCKECEKHLTVSLGLPVGLALVFGLFVMPLLLRYFIDFPKHSALFKLAVITLPAWLVLGYGMYLSRPQKSSCTGKGAFVFASTNEELILTFKSQHYGDMFVTANRELIRSVSAAEGDTGDSEARSASADSRP